MPCLNKDSENGTSLRISVAARSSALSRVQVVEVLKALQDFHPSVEFDIHYLSTIGDRDQTTSLRTLGQTDFFTRDIDLLVQNKTCRLGIHSAKDLPHPLPIGLALLCLTKGLDSSDSLILHPGSTLESLPSGARIGTSSKNREDNVRCIRDDLSFKDIRGTIQDRLSYLWRGEIDGVVIAEAALIRLNLTHLNRISLPGTTTVGQGQLAVIGREGDREMKMLFSCLDVRSRHKES